MKSKKGFTLVELIMVIVVLGILAAVAIPRYFDLTGDAESAAEQGVVGGVRAGISTYFARYRTYPATLDGAANGDCTDVNTCFDNVLAQGGITSDWSKSGSQYTGPAANVYSYNSGAGSFR